MLVARIQVEWFSPPLPLSSYFSLSPKGQSVLIIRRIEYKKVSIITIFISNFIRNILKISLLSTILLLFFNLLSLF